MVGSDVRPVMTGQKNRNNHATLNTLYWLLAGNVH
jgi:hypothetical protein